jgi:hypothetical protein
MSPAANVETIGWWEFRTGYQRSVKSEVATNGIQRGQ